MKADSDFTLFKDGGRLFQAVIAVYEKLVVLSDACFETKKLPEVLPLVEYEWESIREVKDCDTLGGAFPDRTLNT